MERRLARENDLGWRRREECSGCGLGARVHAVVLNGLSRRNNQSHPHMAAPTHLHMTPPRKRPTSHTHVKKVKTAVKIGRPRGAKVGNLLGSNDQESPNLEERHGGGLAGSL